MAVGLLLSSMVACTGNKTSDATCCNGEGECTEQSKCDKNSNCKTNKEMTYSKKYTTPTSTRRQIRSGSSYRSNERHV